MKLFALKALVVAIIATTFVVAICIDAHTSGASPAPNADSIAALCNGITFTDITTTAGIMWKHFNGGFGKRYFPEIKGSGCAIIDYNNDGWPDLLFLNCMNWPGHITSHEPTMALYRNNRDGTFTDVTNEAGLAVPLFGMGVAVGDYDNDGWDDLFITTYGTNHLFHNDHGVFRDITMHAGVAGDSEWHSSAMFIDYDNDGKLDLFVCSYCGWTPENDFYFFNGGMKSYGTPDVYPGLTNHLYHNNGDGTFSDVTRITNIYNPFSKSLGVALCDYDNDGFPDIAVACDRSNNLLFHNNANGTFTNVAWHAGVAAGPRRTHRSGMGIECADFDNDDMPTIVIGNFFDEDDWVYKQNGSDTFVDRADASGIGPSSLFMLKFAVCAADFDHDGLLDILTADGEIHPECNVADSRAQYKEPTQLFRNTGLGKFIEIGSLLPSPLQNTIVGRGIALGDLFNTGNVDAVVSTNDSTPLLLRNDTKNGNGYLAVRLRGIRANRDGIGAKITAICPGWRQSLFIHSGSSYESASQLIANFGLGKNSNIDTLIVKWNANSIDTLTNIPAGQAITITENTKVFQTFLPQQ